jgi:hypothetical protein
MAMTIDDLLNTACKYQPGKFSPKMLIETLCIAQSRIADSKLDEHRKEADIDRLQFLINGLEGFADE